jgi:hypothetical protein
MRTIVDKLHEEQPDDIRVLACKSFAEIGNLTFVQLSTLRHRGAFSTVSLTFAVCCQLTQHPKSSSQPKISGLLRSWWKVGALTPLIGCLLTSEGNNRRHPFSSFNHETIGWNTSFDHRYNVCQCI